MVLVILAKLFQSKRVMEWGGHLTRIITVLTVVVVAVSSFGQEEVMFKLWFRLNLMVQISVLNMCN